MPVGHHLLCTGTSSSSETRDKSAIQWPPRTAGTGSALEMFSPLAQPWKIQGQILYRHGKQQKVQFHSTASLLFPCKTYPLLTNLSILWRKGSIFQTVVKWTLWQRGNGSWRMRGHNLSVHIVRQENCGPNSSPALQVSYYITDWLL